MENDIWNPWHGCKKWSEGCRNCYVYRRDESVGRDASAVYKTGSFDLPLRRDRRGDYKIPSGSHMFCCMTSDFLLDEADNWRGEIWDIIRERQDVNFTIITKRITRFADCIPDDWGDGWDNVAICTTMENQRAADERFPVFKSLPIKRKLVCCEPLLGDIDMSAYLDGEICRVTVGGESGNEARVCDYRWVLHLSEQCRAAGVPFTFKQTGARLLKDGRLYRIRRANQHPQASKAGLNT